MTKNRLRLDVSKDGDVAYLFLPAHPSKAKGKIVDKQISLRSVINNYKGPEIYLDFNQEGEIIGIELLLD